MTNALNNHPVRVGRAALSKGGCLIFIGGVLAILLVSTSSLLGQTNTFESNGGGAIPDATSPGENAGNPDAGIFTSDIVVTNEGTVSSLDAVTMGVLTHSAIGDLVMLLTHEDTGTSVILMQRVFKLNANVGFGSSVNLDQYFTFVSDPSSTLSASDSIWEAAYQALPGNSGSGTIGGGTYAASYNAFTGTDTTSYRPSDFGVFAGEDVAGTWRLTIRDEAINDVGNLGGWSFTATVDPAPEPGSDILLLMGVLVMTASIYRWRRPGA